MDKLTSTEGTTYIPRPLTSLSSQDGTTYDRNGGYRTKLKMTCPTTEHYVRNQSAIRIQKSQLPHRPGRVGLPKRNGNKEQIVNQPEASTQINEKKFR